ncbi:MAG: hypothetical protein GZ088_15175 [Acidipila sp.]|nr:hypothetical protein [Acidipila sp.]
MKLAKNYSHFLGSALAVLTLGATALAQSPAPPPPPHGGDQAFMADRPMGPEHEMFFSYLGMEHGLGDKVVKGAPYSAQSTTETTQVLADGNRIYRKMTGQIFRDSEGRTRRESSFPAIGASVSSGVTPQIAFINDPVAGVRYVLEEQEKIARTIKAHPADMPHVAEGPRHGFAQGQQPQIESLGKQTIEGVEAEGTRKTMTIPAGEMGNDRPLVIVSERWYSQALQTVVMSKHSDPRMGETIFRLTNIRREEPAASLFAVPSDYTVKEGHGFGGHKMMHRPPGA